MNCKKRSVGCVCVCVCVCVCGLWGEYKDTMKHKHKKKVARPTKLLRNPARTQKAADMYGHSIENQQKFLAAQRAINNRIQVDRLRAHGMNPALLPSKIYG